MDINPYRDGLRGMGSVQDRQVNRIVCQVNRNDNIESDRDLAGDLDLDRDLTSDKEGQRVRHALVALSLSCLQSLPSNPGRCDRRIMRMVQIPAKVLLTHPIHLHKSLFLKCASAGVQAACAYAPQSPS